MEISKHFQSKHNFSFIKLKNCITPLKWRRKKTACRWQVFKLQATDE